MKQLIKLSIKCILVLIPLWLAIFYAWHNPLAYLSTDSVPLYWNVQASNTSHDKYYGVLVLGDSTAAASFMPEMMSDDTLNLALPGSSALEGYYTLEDYLSHNEAPTDIFVSYMDYHLEQDSTTWDVSNHVHKFTHQQNKEIYEALNTFDITESDNIPIDDYWRTVLAYELYLPSQYINSITNALADSRIEENTKSYEKQTMRNGRMCVMTNAVADEEEWVAYTDFAITPFQDYYYKKIIELCEENDISLHIIKLPLTFKMAFTDEYVQQVNDYYDDIMDDHDNVEFVWYENSYYTEWYWDIYHMNQHGSMRFGLQLQEDYPKLFSGECSAAQLLMIDDDIDIENIPAELFWWIDGKDYTVLMYYGMGADNSMEDIYPAYLQHGVQYLQNTFVQNVYCVTGDGDGFSDISLNADNDVILVTLPDQSVYTWENYDVDGISFLVIDNANSLVATQKSTSMNLETYQLNYFE